MRSRSLYLALAASALAFAPVSAQGTCTGPTTAFLGLGGSISGCWGAITVQVFYKHALDYSTLGYFPVTGSPLVGPGTPTGLNNGNSGIPFGSPGAVGPQGYITAGPQTALIAPNTGASGELVFALTNLSEGWTNYSGALGRNNNPPPDDIANLLVNVTGYTGAGTGYTSIGTPSTDQYFLLAWEDLNDNCIGPYGGGVTSVAWSAIQPLGGATNLNDNFKPGCTYSGPKTFDSDYNDFYLLLDVQGGGVILQTVTPEPVTMSLLGFGLVAMGGASLRRRKR